MFLINLRHVACPQRGRRARSVFLTNTFLFQAVERLDS
ncbi:hypothetical protein OH687_22975 [Burkholderia anthina]|nr:hypothetical protein OH687_22975 [Burkholderia anthina]